MKKGAACAACPDGTPPPLMPENEEALELWNAVSTQWRAGFSLIGLDYGQVEAWAHRLGIDLSLGMWRKVKALEHQTLKNQHPPKDGEAPRRNGEEGS